jgi:RHS repeat-associated protein
MIQEKINIFRLREPMIKSFYVVNDVVSNQKTGGFKDGNTNPALNDYEYDANDFRVKDFEKVFGEESERSSMVKDRNKGIESITYNHLNLPTRVNFTNNKHISYKYNAAGQKLQKTVNYSDSIKIVDYLDGFQTEAGGSRIPYLTIKKHDEQYAGKVLQFFPHTEGYVKVTAISAGRGLPTSDFAFNYVFNYTDHLGNVRLSYTKDPQTGTLDILDEDHYYPFGLKHGIYAAGNLKDFTLNGDIDTPILEQVRKTEYMYKYNGKELQDELGLNMYAMDMRHYDPAIARWVVHDPITHFYQSPYSAFDGNPVFWADPSGGSVSESVFENLGGTQTGSFTDMATGTSIGAGGAGDNKEDESKVNTNQNNSSDQSFDNEGNKVVTSFEHKYEGTNTGGNLGDDIIIYNQSIYDKNGFMMQYTTAMIIINQKGNISSRSTTVSIKGEGGKWITSSSDSYAYGIDSYASAVSDFKSYDQTSPLQYQAKLNRDYNQKEGNKNHAQGELYRKVSSTAASFIPRVGPVVSEAINLVPNNAKRHEHVNDLKIKVVQEGSFQPTIKFR